MTAGLFDLHDAVFGGLFIRDVKVERANLAGDGRIKLLGPRLHRALAGGDGIDHRAVAREDLRNGLADAAAAAGHNADFP